ncbi:MAG: hypothetical protein LUC94_04375 [Clostridiales bacterium]|nr:hypothetical protein [Clostridiales bacterium]
MITMGVRSQSEPEQIMTNTLPDGQLEVWIRMNISKATQYHSDEDGADAVEYEYDEVYFRAEGITAEDIENDIDGYYSTGAEWAVDVPLTKDARIKALEVSLAQAQAELESTKEDLETAKSENDIAIAELSICIASVLTA